MIWNETRNSNLRHEKCYEAYFSTRSFFNSCWFNLLHLSQNFNCGIVHLPLLPTFSTDEHRISFGVRFVSRNALSSVDAIFLLLQVLRFVPFLTLRPHFHVTSSNSLKRCVHGVKNTCLVLQKICQQKCQKVAFYFICHFEIHQVRNKKP